VTLTGTLVVYLGLSVFVSYMRDRDDIRATVWGEQSFSDRLDKISKTVTTFEWFDPTDWAHLKRIDDRLNQNFLVGAAVYQLGQTQHFARGETLWDALQPSSPARYGRINPLPQAAATWSAAIPASTSPKVPA